MPGALRNFSRLFERRGQAIFRASDFGVMRNTPTGTQRAEPQPETETASTSKHSGCLLSPSD